MNPKNRLGMGIALLTTMLAVPSGSTAWADEMLGVSLPAAVASSITQGGPPDNADTYMTPYVASQEGIITSWKAQFLAGSLVTGCGLPVGIQLKLFRATSATTVQAVAAGAVHDPRAILEARLGGVCPSFLTGSEESVIEFVDPAGLAVSPGDIIGLTITSDPDVDGYFYPLVSGADGRFVMRDVAVGGTIDLADPFTVTLQNLSPALQVNTTAPMGAEVACAIDEPPFDGADFVTIDLRSANRPLNALTNGPLSPSDLTYQFERNGVTFLFQSNSGQPLDALAFSSDGLMSSGFGGAAGISLIINPPVAAIGFSGVGLDGCLGATFVGDTSETFTAQGCGFCDGFLGASGLGDIGAVDIGLSGHVFTVTEVRFALPDSVPPDTRANLELDLSVDQDPPSARCPQSGSQDRVAGMAGLCFLVNDVALEYQLDVTNLGPDPASEVLAVSFLPRGIYDNHSSSGSGAIYDSTTEVVRLHEPTVEVSGEVSVTILATTPADRREFGCGYSLVNVALSTADTPDPDLTNNDGIAVVYFDDRSMSENAEICGDGLDNNCDGRTDCADPNCRCRPTLPPLPGADPGCFFGSLSEGLVELGLFPDTCLSGGAAGGGGGNPAENHACTLPGGTCGDRTVPAFCCDPATLSHSANTLSVVEDCNLGVPGCAPRDPNYKDAIPGVNLYGYGYTGAGQTITYILHYENVGDAEAHDVLILDVLDLDLDDATILVNDGGVYDAATRLVRWVDPVVPPHDPRSVSFQVDVRGDAPPGTRVRNVGTILFPDAVPPTRIDTNFVEHVVPSAGLALVPDLFVSGCTEVTAGSGIWRVHLVNDGPGFAFFASARILNPPDAVTVTQDTVTGFSHPDDLDELPTVIAFATTTSADTVLFETTTPEDPCAALLWRIEWRDIAGNSFSIDVRAKPDGDADAVADDSDNCPTVSNPMQQDRDADGVGDACDGRCLTQTTLFWGSHPWIVNDYAPVTVCGETLGCNGPDDGRSNPSCPARSCDSIMEGLGSLGRELKDNPPYVALVRQLTTAKLNLNASAALGGAGSCSDFEYRGRSIGAWVEFCEGMCGTSHSQIGTSGCIEALDAFIKSADIGFDATPSPFDRPKIDDAGNTTGTDSASFTAAQSGGYVIGKDVPGGADCSGP